MIVNDIEYRQHCNDWCITCVSGPQPNEKCKMCHINRVLADYDGTKIGRPTNHVESGSSAKDA